MAKKKLKTRLDLIQEGLDNQVYVVEAEGKKVADTRNPNLPLYYTNKKLEATRNNDIAPVKTTTKKTSSKKKSNDSIFSSFDDGYDFGDITKSILEGGKRIGNFLDEEVIEPIKDSKKNYEFGKLTEDLGLESYKKMMGEENEYDKIKKKYDVYITNHPDLINDANLLDQTIQTLPNQVGALTSGIKSGGLGAGIGAVGGALIGATAGILGTGGVGAGAGATAGATTGAKLLGGAGYVTGSAEYTYKLESGLQYQTLIEMGVPEDIAKEESKDTGAINALIEGGESILDLVTFGGVSAIKGTLTKGLVKKYGEKTVAKWVGENIVKSAASELVEEATQETVSIHNEKQAAERAGIKRDDSQDFERIKQSAIAGGFAGGLLGGGTAVITGTTKAGINTIQNKNQIQYTQNEQKVVDSLVEEQSNELSRQKAIENAINEAITTRETEQKGILSTKEKTALTEGIKAKIEAGEIDISNTKLTNKEISKIRQEVENNLQQGLLDTNKIDSILGNTITEKDGLLARSYQETAKRSQNFTYDSNKVTNEQEKAVYDSAAKYFNDTTRSHEFVEKVANIAKDKGTNYGFINNEELKSLGHDVEGKQVNGLVRTSQDGKQTVLINVDSPKALNTIVGHETTHLLEGTTEYQELQEAIFNYAKEKGDFDARQKALNDLYEGIDNANVDSEITADLVGDYLFTDEKFINSLSTQKPTVFQKIKDLIDDLVVRFKGTKEEQQLREVQKKFREAYKQNVASKETNTQYLLTYVEKANLNKDQQLRLNTAIELNDNNMATEEIWRKTGVLFDTNDNKTKMYIPDAKFKENASDLLKLDTKVKLSDVLEGRIFETNPELKDYYIKVTDFEKLAISEGETNTDKYKKIKGATTYDKGILLNDTIASLSEAENVLAHEIQHLIQELSGDNEASANLSLKDYRNSPTEIEAEVNRVMNSMTEYQRKNIDPKSIENEIKKYYKENNYKILDVDKVISKLENKHGIKYSLTDNQGRTLTKEQQEYFKDSKVRDENGNLITMYHGTEFDFTEFDISKLGLNSRDNIKGIWLTSDENYASTFAGKNMLKGYVNITNRLDELEVTMNLEDLQKAVSEFSKDYDVPVINKPEVIERFYNQENASDISIYNNITRAIPFNKQAFFNKYIKEYTGKDGILFQKGDGEYYAVAFESNQFKNIDNTNPTDNPDINLSLSKQREQIAPSGNYNVYGEDVKLQQTIAPLQEEIQTLTESVNELKEQLAPVQEVKFAPTPQNIVEQQGQEAFNNIDESSMPMETDDYIPDESGKMTSSKSLFETRNYEELGNRKINAYQYDNPEVKPYFQAEAQAMLGDLKASTKGKRFYSDELYYWSGGEKGYFGTDRQTTNDIAELLDGLDGKYKLSYADIEKGLNAIINDEGAENNAASKRIEMYLDKRLREGYTTVDGIEVPANQDYINMMAVKEMNDYYNSLPITDDMIPGEYVEKSVENVSNSKEIAPIKKIEQSTPRKTESSIPEPINKAYQLTIDGKAEKIIDNSTYKEIAEVLTNEPKTESDRNKRKWAIFKANVFDKGMVFEDLSLKERNRELMGKWDYTLTSEARGQNAIGQGHYDNETGTIISKSLNDIRETVDSTGLTKEFYEYMYHKHNVDRMTLDKRFGIENKPVFGNVTAEQSQKIVNEYEKSHPEFLEFAQDVYDYVNADKKLLVDNGVISQETSDLWSKMYPHYVPTRRTTDIGLDINVPLDTKRTGINAPVKKATGGSADILPLFDTMAMRTLQTYRATAKNSFGVELKNTLGTTIESTETNIDEVIDSVDTQESLLQEGKKGRNPTFTVFENGEKITFEITPDMYDALKPLSDSSLLSKTIKPLNVANNIRRGLLTEYNPTFMLTNAIKDTQDVLVNSQHALRTYSKIPEAHKQLLTKGYWYKEYVANGGNQNSYFDNQTNTFATKNKGLSRLLDIPPLSTVSKINNYIEMIPRLSEYIASRESGRSIETSMLDAARVTTNFKAGGALTKALNRNGFTFLNASVQGAMQQVRNVREAKANGIKGWVNLATKFTLAGLPAILLNNLVWEDDEEYEELSDYVKQNYYVVAKDDNGNFIRIPKGRTLAVIQEGINQMSNLITGDDEADLKTFIDLALNNLAPNNPIENNIASPIVQVLKNEAWYGDDLVPTRLQNRPAAEQYDESTDMFSRWIGETFNVSPYKVNYLIDQYSGGIGDVVLPMLTPEAKSDADTIGEQLLAPLKSKFTTNSTLNNQNVSDFYDLKDELTIAANKSNATDEDVLKNKYINSVNAELSELYEEKRNIQNSDLSNSEKYRQAMEIQEQINEISKNALSEYTNVKTGSNYSTVGDREYYKYINDEGKEYWSKVNDEEAENLNNLGMTYSEKNTYFKIKDEIGTILDEYKNNKENLNESNTDYEESVEELTNQKKSDIIDKIKGTGFSDEQKAYMYKKYYNSDTIDMIVSSGINVDAYLDYAKQDIEADKDRQGNSIPYSRKNKVIKYVNSLNLSIPEKAILIKATNTFKFNEYNNQIVNYLNDLDISYEERVAILEELDMKVGSDGRVTWD